MIGLAMLQGRIAIIIPQLTTMNKNTSPCLC